MYMLNLYIERSKLIIQHIIQRFPGARKRACHVFIKAGIVLKSIPIPQPEPVIIALTYAYHGMYAVRMSGIAISCAALERSGSGIGRYSRSRYEYIPDQPMTRNPYDFKSLLSMATNLMLVCLLVYSIRVYSCGTFD